MLRVRFDVFMYPTVRFGVVFRNHEYYGAVRFGFEESKNPAMRGSVRVTDRKNRIVKNPEKKEVISRKKRKNEMSRKRTKEHNTYILSYVDSPGGECSEVRPAFFFFSIPYMILALLSPPRPVVTQIRRQIEGPPLLSPPRYNNAFIFYREKNSAFSSRIDSRRIVRTHAAINRLSQQLIHNPRRTYIVFAIPGGIYPAPPKNN